MLVTDASGNVSAAAANGVTGSGTNNYLPKWTSTGSTIGNSLFQDNGTSTAINIVPSVIYQMYVYRSQLTANGDGQHSLFGYRTRDSQNDGTGYSQITGNSATAGFNFWGDVYTWGVGGWNYNDYSRCGGVMGADVNGLTWGSLGYRSSGLLNYGVYGNSAYASGGGFLPAAGGAGIGGGFFGDFVGSFSKGATIGQLNSGSLFATYNQGNTYTVGKNVELVSNNGTVTPVYAVTSMEATLYAKGNANLNNGSTFIAFDSKYAALLGENPVVTVSANGECNGVYVQSVSKTGFYVKEMGNGSSNVTISWIAVGNRIDNAVVDAATAMVSASDFDRNVSQVLYSDGNLDGAALGMWWDGNAIQFGAIPAHLNAPAKR
jgi:hypothetical protein